MLDPRIYRTGLIAVALAVIILAFSLVGQQGPLGATLAPNAFNGLGAAATMTSLARSYPDRRPGSPGDQALAATVARRLRSDGLAVSERNSTLRTVEGKRSLVTVTGTLAGSSSGSIVIVSHRDAVRSPATADLSGTAVLLELAQDLSGETHNRTVVLVSTSGSAGAAGATQFARTLPGPIDAVLALGDLAGAHVHSPLVVPWSNRQLVAPPMLRRTVADALQSRASLQAGTDGLAGQFVHLAVPMAVTEQAPFDARGIPAVLLSASGERGPGPGEPTSASVMTGLGRTALATISALDAGPQVPAPSTYLLFAGKVIPLWAVRLFVLALILPVLATAIDGFARARRRGHSILRWSVWVLSAALPFLAAVALVAVLGAVGLIAGDPPGPVGADGLQLTGGEIATMLVLACVVAGGFAILRPRAIGEFSPETAGSPEAGDAGAGAALLVVLCAVALAMWFANPFTAALIVPALHMWLWIADPEIPVRRSLAVTLLLAGLAAPFLAAFYYLHALALTPPQLAWNLVVLLAGGGMGTIAAVEWSVVLGCAASAALLALRAAGQTPAKEESPVTVRGPITYAGPGSLGSTHSALRR